MMILEDYCKKFLAEHGRCRQEFGQPGFSQEQTEETEIGTKNSVLCALCYLL